MALTRHVRGMTTCDELHAYEGWLRAQGARPSTIDKRLVVVAAGLRDWPSEPTSDDLTDWLGRPGLAAWSRVTYYGHVRSYFRWLHETGRREDNPTDRVPAPKAPRGQPRPLTDAECARVMVAADGRMRLWLLLSLLAGLRAHEVAKLRREDVTERAIFVRGKGGREDYLPTHPDLWAVIEPMPGGWLFPSPRGGHVTAHSVSVETSRHFSRLGVAGSLHRCRHTFGTRLLRSGTNIRVVQELMRHTSLEVTARYLLVDDDEASAAIRALAA